jgi:hypothetical protein
MIDKSERGYRLHLLDEVLGEVRNEGEERTDTKASGD